MCYFYIASKGKEIPCAFFEVDGIGEKPKCCHPENDEDQNTLWKNCEWKDTRILHHCPYCYRRFIKDNYCEYCEKKLVVEDESL